MQTVRHHPVNRVVEISLKENIFAEMPKGTLILTRYETTFPVIQDNI